MMMITKTGREMQISEMIVVTLGEEITITTMNLMGKDRIIITNRKEGDTRMSQ